MLRTLFFPLSFILLSVSYAQTDVGEQCAQLDLSDNGLSKIAQYMDQECLYVPGTTNRYNFYSQSDRKKVCECIKRKQDAANKEAGQISLQRTLNQIQKENEKNIILIQDDNRPLSAPSPNLDMKEVVELKPNNDLYNFHSVTEDLSQGRQVLQIDDSKGMSFQWSPSSSLKIADLDKTQKYSNYCTKESEGCADVSFESDVGEKQPKEIKVEKKEEHFCFSPVGRGKLKQMMPDPSLLDLNKGATGGSEKMGKLFKAYAQDEHKDFIFDTTPDDSGEIQLQGLNNFIFANKDWGKYIILNQLKDTKFLGEKFQGAIKDIESVGDLKKLQDASMKEIAKALAGIKTEQDYRDNIDAISAKLDKAFAGPPFDKVPKDKINNAFAAYEQSFDTLLKNEPVINAKMADAIINIRNSNINKSEVITATYGPEANLKSCEAQQEQVSLNCAKALSIHCYLYGALNKDKPKSDDAIKMEGEEASKFLWAFRSYQKAAQDTDAQNKVDNRNLCLTKRVVEIGGRRIEGTFNEFYDKFCEAGKAGEDYYQQVIVKLKLSPEKAKDACSHPSKSFYLNMPYNQLAVDTALEDYKVDGKSLDQIVKEACNGMRPPFKISNPNAMYDACKEGGAYDPEPFIRDYLEYAKSLYPNEKQKIEDYITLLDEIDFDKKVTMSQTGESLTDRVYHQSTGQTSYNQTTTTTNSAFNLAQEMAKRNSGVSATTAGAGDKGAEKEGSSFFDNLMDGNFNQAPSAPIQPQGSSFSVLADQSGNNKKENEIDEEGDSPEEKKKKKSSRSPASIDEDDESDPETAALREQIKNLEKQIKELQKKNDQDKLEQKQKELADAQQLLDEQSNKSASQSGVSPGSQTPNIQNGVNYAGQNGGSTGSSSSSGNGGLAGAQIGSGPNGISSFASKRTVEVSANNSKGVIKRGVNLNDALLEIYKDDEIKDEFNQKKSESNAPILFITGTAASVKTPENLGSYKNVEKITLSPEEYKNLANSPSLVTKYLQSKNYSGNGFVAFSAPGQKELYFAVSEKDQKSKQRAVVVVNPPRLSDLQNIFNN